MKLVLFTVVFIVACAPRGTAEQAAPQTTTINAQIDSVALIRDVSVLSHDSMEGRLVGTPGSAKARAYLERRFREVGVQPVGGQSYLHTFEITRGTPPTTVHGTNIIGMVRGSAVSDRYIVVTAHYDHVGVREGQVFNGADDNASGTGGLLQIAQYFARNRPRHSMIFVAFDAEEGGLRGARAFVANPPVPKEAISLNINMDMIGRNDRGELYVAGTYHYPQLKPAVQRGIAVAEVTLIAGHDTPQNPRDDWTSQSDQGAFHAQRIPFLYFGVEDHPDYHKATDDFERIQQGFYARAVRSVLAVVREIDRTGIGAQ